MTLVDRDIRALIQTNKLQNAAEDHVGAVSYDLRTMYYVQQEGEFKECFELAPGESVFVGCEEIIAMPNDMIGRIILRNSRIRGGMMLDAPVYQPGHTTRIFFRITNVSEKSIRLDKSSSFASIMFEQLEHAPNAPYNGTFQNELDFRDLAKYRKDYKMELVEVQEKAESIRNVEKNIYSNVLTLMTVFIALFSLININVELAYADAIETARLIVFNLTTIGSIAFLAALIRLAVVPKKKSEFKWLLALAVLFLGASIWIVLGR